MVAPPAFGEQALTRRDLLVRGAFALAATSVAGRLLLDAAPAAAATAATACAVGAFDPASRFAALTGSSLKLTSTFVAWDEDFPNACQLADRAAGRKPLIAWDAAPDLRALAQGEYDDLLHERAAACRAYGAPLYLRWAAEFNGDWNPVFGRTTDFVAAWRHLVTTFRAAGADNVKWVFCPYAFDVRAKAANDWRAYYPGDAYVDWVGMDGYNWGATRAWSRWQRFGEIFAPLYRDYAPRKPLMVCEVASAEKGGDKAAWIADMGAKLRGPFARVRAFAWFDVDKETDWRVNSSDASLAAFRALVAEPRYA